MGALSRFAMQKAASYIVRRLGRSFDGIGKTLQGELSVTESMGSHRAVAAYQGKQPNIGADSFVAPSASVIGDVTLGQGSSVWYGAVLRGDVNGITVGSNSHIGDRTVVHVASSEGSIDSNPMPTIIGQNVSIGPLSVIHACTLGDGATVGGSTTLLDGCNVQAGAVITRVLWFHQASQCHLVSSGVVSLPSLFARWDPRMP